MPKVSVVAIPVRDEAERIGACLAAFARQSVISGWGWLVPPGQPLPVKQMARYRLPIAAHLQAKRSAVAAHASQYFTLIDDSPEGFHLPPELLSVFEQPYEVFLAHE
jgi:hypothetical protein